jgi:hypothetical protein
MQVNITMTDASYNGERLNALATFLRPTIAFGATKVTINVQDKHGNTVLPAIGSTNDDIVSTLSLALKGNQHLVDIFTKSASADAATVTMYPIFSKKVVTFYNDDMTDYYNNYRSIVSDMFKVVLWDQVSTVRILPSTSPNEAAC